MRMNGRGGCRSMVAGALLASGLQAGAVMPRVMLLVDEQSLGAIATSEVEALAIQRLQEHGIPVVDQDMVRANLKKNQQLFKMAGDNRGAATLGLQFGAEAMITGEAVAKPSARRIGDSNLRAYQAVVTLRAIRTDNSETMASASQAASIIDVDDVAGSSKALKKAAQASLGELIPKMIAAWGASGAASSTGMTRVVATFGGVDQAWKLKAVREALRGQPGKIVNVVQRSYTAGSASFELDAAMTPQELGEMLVLSPPDGVKFQILSASAGALEMRAVAAP